MALADGQDVSMNKTTHGRLLSSMNVRFILQDNSAGSYTGYGKLLTHVLTL